MFTAAVYLVDSQAEFDDELDSNALVLKHSVSRTKSLEAQQTISMRTTFYNKRNIFVFVCSYLNLEIAVIFHTKRRKTKTLFL